MNWNIIKDQDDVDSLMALFGGFHDGCLREAHLWTGHWVSNDLAMTCPDSLDNCIRILVQRQFKDPFAIELLFGEVARFNLVPSPENYESIIFEDILLVQDGTIYYPPNVGWWPESPSRDEVTLVSAKRLRWRRVEWLSEELHYGRKPVQITNRCRQNQM